MNETKALQPGVRLQSKDRTYEIVKVLGVGTFGITYLATSNIPIGNIVTTIKFAIKEYFPSDSCCRGDDGISVKVLPKTKSNVATNRVDFINEANRLKKICHKSRNIVSVNETFEANGTAYYVMEYLDGGNPTKCSEDEAVSIVMQIADALEKIHDDGVIHMDLRPDNIVMKTNEKNGTYPVLIDFGISLYFDNKGKSGTTLSIKGNSPGYSPPEQVAGKCGFSPQYDIYALGAVLFFLCIGKTPPDGKDISPDQSELRQMLDGKVSANVETAILNAMNPNAEGRTPSLQKFRDDIMGIVFMPKLDVSENRLDFSKEKSQRTIDVDANIDWTAYADEDWCSISKAKDSVTVSVAKNNESNARTCNIFINGINENVSQLIHIKQSGGGTVVFHEDTWWETNSRKVYTGVGISAILAGIVGLCIWLMPSSSSEPGKMAEVTQQLPQPEENHQEEISAPTEENPGELTSIENPQTPTSTVEEAPTQPVREEKPAEETNDAKFTRASRTNDAALMLSLAKANYTKAYYPVALNYYNKGDEDQAQTWAQKAVSANVNRAQAQSLLDKMKPTPPQPTDDELFAKASSISDFKALADKGYAKAYAPLAEKYFSAHDYSEADKYARRALTAKIGRDKAISVIDKLELIGFYDNGENGGKPKY